MEAPDCPACRVCRVCRGPVQAGFARCYQCDVASSQAGGLLADVVVPVRHAVKGGQLAADLRLYKSDRSGAGDAAARLRSLLSGFLRDHGECVWRAAGMPYGPAAVAVVPSGQGRAGAHPLAGIVESCTDLPVIRLTAGSPGAACGRGVSLGWLRVSGQAAGDVLLVDDCWVSGGSAQSAAAALKLAGAVRVAVVVLGRHVDPADPRSAGLLRALRSSPGLPGSCCLGAACVTPRAG